MVCHVHTHTSHMNAGSVPTVYNVYTPKLPSMKSECTPLTNAWSTDMLVVSTHPTYIWMLGQSPNMHRLQRSHIQNFPA